MKNIELELPCELTQEEIQYRAQELGVALVEYDELDQARKDAAKEYAEELARIRFRLRRLGEIVRRKIEQRIVKCIIQFRTPEADTKRIVRCDTGEIVREEPMSTAECQQSDPT